MALLSFLPEVHSHKRKKSKQPTSSSSWDQIKNLVTCKQMEASKIHDPSISSSRVGNSPETRLLHNATRHGSSSSYPRGMPPLRKLSGCYECHSIVDPTRYPLPRTTLSACPDCGEVFTKIETLELHQAATHAVSELGPDDSGRNIVEIIFKSSWLKHDTAPVCKIDRILKVHNAPRTIQRFEDYRDAVKARARRSPRCAADGNELLRFHCATLACPLGARGVSALCGSGPPCGVCVVIRHGFQAAAAGVLTTASSGRAHDCLPGEAGARRAMLVCRVIAGRVRRAAEEESGAESPAAGGGSYDSVAGCGGAYSELEEVYVFHARAILPCFVVIYRAVES